MTKAYRSNNKKMTKKGETLDIICPHCNKKAKIKVVDVSMRKLRNLKTITEKERYDFMPITEIDREFFFEDTNDPNNLNKDGEMFESLEVESECPCQNKSIEESLEESLKVLGVIE